MKPNFRLKLKNDGLHFGDGMDYDEAVRVKVTYTPTGHAWLFPKTMRFPDMVSVMEHELTRDWLQGAAMRRFKGR